MNMELFATIFPLAIGSIVTWAVSKWYYRRSKDDFSILLSKLDKISMHDQGGKPDKAENTNIEFRDHNFKDPNHMDAIENAILGYVKTSGLERGFYEYGLPVHEIENVIRRLDGIRASLERYKHTRICMGA
ncbi:MAG: hypothetical protein HWN69_08260 [Desulfobacterales bacterium]|nr:hypothetical protein [Desulfobacterales bacterium]